MTREQIEIFANAEHPTGVGPWRIAGEKAFHEGNPMPCVCESDPGRLHWLLHC